MRLRPRSEDQDRAAQWLYLVDSAAKANFAVVSPEVQHLLAALRKQYDTLNALLQINLTVLATAHAVSKG